MCDKGDPCTVIGSKVWADPGRDYLRPRPFVYCLDKFTTFTHAPLAETRTTRYLLTPKQHPCIELVSLLMHLAAVNRVHISR